MKKFWSVFLYEYRRHVLRKRFIFALLGMPLMVLFIAAFGFISVLIQYKNTPIGYIDQAGVIVNPEVVISEDTFMKPVALISFTDDAAARQALDAGTVQGVYILHPEYLDNGQVDLIAPRSVSPNAQSDFSAFLRLNLLEGKPGEIKSRLLSGPEVEILSIDGSRQASSQRILSIILPIAVGLLFLIVINMTGGYLLQAVVEEKENRTMEIIVTSVSPNQLMIGKTLADLCVGLTQLAAWLGFAAIGLVVAGVFSPWVAMQEFELGSLLLIVALVLPAFIMIAGLMAATGAMVTETRESQQMVTMFTLPLFVPMWLLYPIMINPNSPLAVGLSLFPLTSPMTLPLRAAFTTIPAWQIAAGLVLIYACAAGALLLAGRAFRMGMLSYGKRLTWREVFQRG